jgi:hypothetical protein
MYEVPTLKRVCYIKIINELLYFAPQWNWWERTPPQKLSDNQNNFTPEISQKCNYLTLFGAKI